MMEALRLLAAEKGISVDTLLEALADALESAYKRMPGRRTSTRWVEIDPDTGDIQVIAQELDEDGEPSATSATTRPTTSAASPRRPPSR